MTEVYLVRHGETEWSITGRHTSTTELALTDAGRRQAEMLRTQLDPAVFDLILRSPRDRAMETAQHAGFVGAAEPVADTDLAEWDYGDYEGLTSEDIIERHPGWQLWTDGCPGGEQPDQILDRMRRLTARICDQQPERVICFGHGHALRVLTLCWLQLDIERGDQFPLHTATISVLGAEKQQPALLRWNQ